MQPIVSLKLAALDAEDLMVISAHVQDAVLRAGDLVWDAPRHRFAFAMNRFAWEANGGRRRRQPFQRHRSAMHFDRVLSAKSTGIDRTAPDAIISLLAIEFIPAEAPAGEIRLLFSAGGEIRLTVECIEAQLADLGAAWQTNAKPAHKAADVETPA